MNRLLGLMLILVWLLTGCRKDLCYDHLDHAPGIYFDVKAQWEQKWEHDYGCNWKNNWQIDWKIAYEELNPKKALGIGVVVYGEEGIYLEDHLPQEGGKFTLLAEGKYDMLFYNDDTEYIVYDNKHSLVDATATTRTAMRGGFSALHAEERTMNQPDMLYGYYLNEYQAERTVDYTPLSVKMTPLVYTYYIRYEFSYGLKYVALARGAIAGMAEKVYLYDGHTGDDVATILFDCQLKDYGAEAQVMSFGLPNYPGRYYNRTDGDERNFMLNLEVRLTNGDYKTFEFDITEQLKSQPRGGVLVLDGLEVTDEEGKSKSGITVEVEDWGEYIDIPLPMN